MKRAWRRYRAARKRKAFDPVYYFNRYPDLQEISTVWDLRDHFARHGRKEGRFANSYAEEEEGYRQFLTKSGSFDLVAYKTLNPDLSKVYSTDKEYIIHYIRHGKKEGRPAVFDGDSRRQSGSPVTQFDGSVWRWLFSVSHFSAWLNDGTTVLHDRDHAFSIFEKHIDRLPPIHMDYDFDPRFYRDYYHRSRSESDLGAYRDWLEAGFPSGRAPNEARLLLPYTGGAPWPLGLDLSAYVVSRALPSRHRAHDLVHLFEREESWEEALDLIATINADFMEKLANFRANRGRMKDVLAILDAWKKRGGSWSVRMSELAGDANMLLNRISEAWDAYGLWLQEPKRTFESLSKAVRMCLSAGNHDVAVAILQQDHDRWRGKTDFENLVGEIVDRMFERLSADGHAMIRSGEVGGKDLSAALEMNVHMRAGLARIVEVIDELERAPARLETNEFGPVVILGNESIRQCTYYRVEQKAYQLKSAGVELQRFEESDVSAFLAALVGARAAIFYRLPATPANIRAILTARKMGVKTYYDIDDLIFCPEHYPPAYETYGEQISGEVYRGLQFGVPLFNFAMSLCDRAIASTPALLEHMEPIVRERRGMVLRNALDERNDVMLALGSRLSAEHPDHVRIFYGSGTLAHAADFTDLVAPALARLLRERENVDLVLIGHVPDIEGEETLSARIFRYPIVSDIEGYWSILSTCQINLAVLHPDAQSDCKSEIKWLEAATLGIPTVASPTATYRDVIDHGRDGLIANDVHDWYGQLSLLVTDGNARRAIGQRAREKALAGYRLGVGASLWEAELAVPRKAVATRRPRILICNVFFAPQSVGGATRVVEDNVFHIVRDHPGIELAVFCTDEGAPPGSFRSSQFGAVPVFRVGVKAGIEGEATAFNDDQNSAFERVLDIYMPDLVHFHCVQRLTASIVRVCLERRVPYVVTLHDAWWISRQQFLVDDDGFLRQPRSDWASYGVSAVAPSTDARERVLAAMLAGAERVWSVSESFADVYRAAGISWVEVIPNGVPDLPDRFAPDRRAGPLRLAHIGGRSSYKGAHLVEAAFRYGDYPNLSLLMIDGHLSAGDSIRARWGSSEVTISAHVSADRLGALYTSFDVLLAPSRWPESFGLVAREAAHFGLWVVASEIGAMGEDLIEGKNGFRIDTSDRVALDRVLVELNGNPDRYRQGTALLANDLRTSAMQADEIARMYIDLVK